MKLVKTALFVLLLSVSYSSQASFYPIRTYNLSGIVFVGEGGGWNPSILRCQRYADSMQGMASFRSDQGFIEFTGLCEQGGFESTMTSKIRSNLPQGRYLGPIYCAASSVVEVFQTRARIISTPNLQFVVVRLPGADYSCQPGSHPFQTEIYFQ